MKTTHIQDNQYDPFLTFVSLKEKYPDAFFFQRNVEDKAHLTVIGLRPSKVLRAQDHDENFLKVIEDTLNEQHRPSAFPFEHGGLFGCLGHEIIKLIEPKLKHSGYLQSAGIEAEVFVVKNLIVFEHMKNVIHFILEDEALTVDTLKRKIPEVHSTSTEVNDQSLKPHLGKKKFIEGVTRIKEHIKEGDIFQAVLSERFEKKISSSPLQIFKNVRERGVGAYSFFFDLKDSAFFGSSPEMLLEIKNGQMETHPIAGTMPRGKTPVSDKKNEAQLNHCPKEAAEHLMLVDLARNDLGQTAVPGTVKVTNYRSLLKLSNVMHLKSIVKGEKKNAVSEVTSFKSCFPAGTLSGAPKVKALEILSEIETRPRGYYGGAVVAFDFNGDLESCIAIRSIEVKKGVAILRAGAGIVQDSVPEKEYEEIQHKIKNMLLAIDEKELA